MNISNEIIVKLINDSGILAKITEEIKNEQELIDLVYNFPNIKNIKNIIKLYEKYYDFNQEELLILIEDLNFLGSKSISLILIFLKYKKINPELINRYLVKQYNDITLKGSLFLTLIYYDIFEHLDNYFNKSEMCEAVKISVEKDNLNCLIFLIDKGYNKNNRNGKLLLKLITEQNGTNILRYLFKNNFDIHIRNYRALGEASENGNLEVVKFLIEKGADIHADDDYSLRSASKNGHLEVVKFLIEKGNNIHVH